MDKKLNEYLDKQSIVKTGKRGGFEQYRVALGYPREDAIQRLREVSDDMAVEFGIMPSCFVCTDRRVTTTNAFGTFYITI